MDGSEQKGNQVRNLLKEESEEFFKNVFSHRDWPAVLVIRRKALGIREGYQATGCQ